MLADFLVEFVDFYTFSHLMYEQYDDEAADIILLATGGDPCATILHARSGA